MKKAQKITLGLMFVTLIVINAYQFALNRQFPVEYKICSEGYVDCFTVAKLDDMVSCEQMKEKWSWYCDSTNPKDIRCHEGESNASDSLCSD